MDKVIDVAMGTNGAVFELVKSGSSWLILREYPDYLHQPMPTLIGHYAKAEVADEIFETFRAVCKKCTPDWIKSRIGKESALTAKLREDSAYFRRLEETL